jgi:iron(III) transport system substrate-binding protein
MPNPRRRAIAAAVALLAAVLIAGCGGASEPPNTITIYNAQHEQTTNALIAAFTKATGIHVRVENNGEDVLTAQIEQEGGRSPADVFFTENSNWLQQLDDRGMLTKVEPSTLANIPARDNATDGSWVGVTARFSALIYNPSKISAAQVPTSVMALAEPQFKGKLEIAPAETDFWPVISSVARAAGNAAAVRWLEGLKNNAGGNDAIPDNETVTSDVNNATSALALINHYYFYRLKAEIGASAMHAKLAYLAPGDPGAVEDIAAAGILKSSYHQADAQKFLAFLTSAAGHGVIARSDSFEYPLHPGVAPNPALPPISVWKPSAFTQAQLGTGLNARTLLQQAGLI